MGEPFLGIDHLGLVVKDLDKAARCYVEQLGFELIGSEQLPDRGIEVRFVDTGNGRLELIAATGPNSEVSKFLEKRGEGLHHICLRVADLKATLISMKERGVQLIDEEPRAGADGRAVAFIHPKAAHGVLIELVEQNNQAS